MEIKNIVNIGSRIILLGIGFTGGYCYAQKKLAEEYEKRIEEDLESFREVARRRQPKEETEEVVEPEIVEDDNQESVETEYRDYSKLAGRYAKPSPEELIKEVAAKEEEDSIQANERDMDKRPYLISDIQFHEENDNYDKVTLFYYAVDDVLTEEDETVVDDRERLLGVYEINPDEDPSTAYFRNDRLMIDYEVNFIYGAYSVLVAGEDEE